MLISFNTQLLKLRRTNYVPLTTDYHLCWRYLAFVSASTGKAQGLADDNLVTCVYASIFARFNLGNHRHIKLCQFWMSRVGNVHRNKIDTLLSDAHMCHQSSAHNGYTYFCFKRLRIFTNSFSASLIPVQSHDYKNVGRYEEACSILAQLSARNSVSQTHRNGTVIGTC